MIASSLWALYFYWLLKSSSMHETRVSEKSPKLLWNILPKLNKKIIRKVLSQRRKLFAYPQECQQNLHTSKRSYVRTCQCRFWTFQTNKILSFSGKKTHISEVKISFRHWVLVQRKRYHKSGTYPKRNCYSLPWIENGVTWDSVWTLSYLDGILFARQ